MAEYKGGPTSESEGNDFTKNLNPATAGLYYANMAALNFSVQKALAEGKLAKENTNLGYNYNRGQLLKQEPIRFQANRNAANSAGLAESGTLAQTQQRTASDFADRATRMAQQRSQAVQRINQGEQSAVGGANIGQLKAAAGATAEQAQWLAEHPPPKAESAPSTPSTTPKGYSNNPPYIHPLSAGYGTPGYIKPLRKIASKKAVG